MIQHLLLPICSGRGVALRGRQREPALKFMQLLETDAEGKVRKTRCFLAVDADTILLDKKTPAEDVLEGCFEPSITRWGPCWSFRRFGLADAAHRSKEGSPFRKC